MEKNDQNYCEKNMQILSKIVIDGAVLDCLIWSEFPAESVEITNGVTYA